MARPVVVDAVCWLLLLATTTPAGGSRRAADDDDDHPVGRHVGRWVAPPAFPDFVPQNTVWERNGTATHDPAYMMQPQPLAGNGDIGLCFDGPPEETTFHLTTTSFWCSNVAPDSSRTVPHYRYEFFTHTRIGTLSLSAPSMEGASYSATQELHAARINASFGRAAREEQGLGSSAAALPSMHHSSIVTATDSVVLTRLTVRQRTPVVLTLRHPTSWVYGPNLPAEAGWSLQDEALWMWRRSVVQVNNSLVGANCFVGGQRPASQLFVVDERTRAVTLQDGRCLQMFSAAADGKMSVTIGACSGGGVAAVDWVLRPAAPPRPLPPPPPPPLPPAVLRYFTAVAHTIGAQPPSSLYHCRAAAGLGCESEAAAMCMREHTCAGFAVCATWHNGTVAELFTAAQVAKSAANDLWTLFKKKRAGDGGSSGGASTESGYYELAHVPTGMCVALSAGLNTLPLQPCNASSTRWSYNASSLHVFEAGGVDSWGAAWEAGGARCVTAVEPNPLVAAGLAVQLRSANGSIVKHVMPLMNASDGSASIAATIEAGEYDVVTALETRGDCRGCRSDIVAVHEAALAAVRAATPSRLRVAHAEWWRRYWNASMVDLGPRWRTLESFYYGAWGPWTAVDDPGWMGDYALNYNFEAPLFGVFSDNRPELSEPYFAVMQNAVELGRWRAGLKSWHSGTYGHVAGQNVNSFQGMEQTSADGRSPVPAAYDGLELPIHLAPWPSVWFASDWGQKSAAAFSAKPFIDYFDFTWNMTFLKDVAYPYCRQAASFYETYATKTSTGGTYQYNIEHSCANEGCMAAGRVASHLNGSSNTAMDLGFARMLFRALLRFSEILNVDEDKREIWADMLRHLAPFPMQQDESGETVFASSAGVNDSFPLASTCHSNWSHHNASGFYRQGLPVSEMDISGCRNARYPIVYFNSIFPSLELDLSASPELLSVARRTVGGVNFLNGWSPTNGLCLAWPPASRIVTPAGSEQLLTTFEQALNLTMQPNFVPFLWNRPGSGSGCTTEQAGATKAINDLLVATHGHGDNASIRVLPGGWMEGSRVSFHSLRVTGAFLVSARAVGTVGAPKLESLTILSLAGNTVALYWAQTQAPLVTLLSNGSSVAVSKGSTNVFKWSTAADATYHVTYAYNKSTTD